MNNLVREPLDVRKQVGIAVVYWFVCSAEYRTVARLFRVGTSTVYKCVNMQ